MEKKATRDITFPEAMGILIFYIAVFALGIGKINTNLSILICAIGTIMYGVYMLRIPYDEIFASILKIFQRGMPSILVLYMVGFISSSWLASGTIPTLIVYGLEILNPSIFLFGAFVVCAIGSIATGSSWSIVATFGVAMMGIGQGMGMPMGLVGGAIVSGCWIGDKWSPLSDTTNIGAAMNGLNIFELFKHMLPTSGLAGILAAIVYLVIGFRYSGGELDVAGIESLVGSIEGLFTINPLMLLPIVAVIYFSIKRKPVLPVLMLGIVLSVILAVTVQGKDFIEVLNCLYGGYVTETGVENIDSLLSGGGLVSVSSIMIVIFCAFTIAGALDRTQVMPCIANKLKTLVKKRGSLTLLSVLTGIFGTFLGGTAYTGVILNTSMYEDAYEKAGLTKLDLARAALEGSGNTNAIVPWCGSHVMIVTCLGVTWTEFLPYYFSLWFGMGLMVLYGYTGWFFGDRKIRKVKEDTASIEA